TFKVNVSQVNPSWHKSSPPINVGALIAPPPVAVPSHVTGVVAVGLMVAPDGVEADVLLNAGKAMAIASATKIAAIETRHPKRDVLKVRECSGDVEFL
ncbi:MAG TPA: hypothetical protein VFO99_09175, partial [Pyrinomonadaceae bacterium]|nr:hypothetical protein [Pyrinomonadaceae bacterium]